MFTVYSFFLIILIAAITGIAIWFRRSPYNGVQTVLCFICLLLTKFLWRTTSPKSLPVPENSGVVLFSNHRSSVDPFYIQQGANRLVHWMVAEDFGRSGLISFILDSMEVINVSRSGQDTAALKQGIRCVKRGGALGIFPEGRINMGDDFMMPVRPGAVAIALKGRVPILPVFIEGSTYGGFALSPFLMPTRVIVHFGKPIDLSPWYDRNHKESLGEIALLCAKEICKLAGREDFEPTLAGRDWKPSKEEIDELNAKARREQM